jgi:hypothetical protein
MAMSTRAAFSAALNMTTRAVRMFGRPAMVDGREAQATTLGFAFVGAATLHGDSSHVEHSSKPSLGRRCAVWVIP